MLAIFKDVLTAPQFNEEKIDVARTQMRNAIARRNDDAGRIAHRELSDILYGRDTPYGREQEYATVGNILRSDLQAFHARYFFPRNTMLAIRGDFDSAAMKAQIEKLFADWTVEQPPPEFPKVNPAPNPDAAGIYLATKKDISQTFFSLGQLGGLLNEKDYAALAIMADILGGGPSSRLAQRMRTRMSSRLHHFGQVGSGVSISPACSRSPAAPLRSPRWRRSRRSGRKWRASAPAKLPKRN